MISAMWGDSGQSDFFVNLKNSVKLWILDVYHFGRVECSFPSKNATKVIFERFKKRQKWLKSPC